jgi:hypothetical protein
LEAEKQRLAQEAALKKRQEEVDTAERNLAAAVANVDYSTLNDALNKAMQLGISSAMVIIDANIFVLFL